MGAGEDAFLPREHSVNAEVPVKAEEWLDAISLLMPHRRFNSTQGYTGKNGDDEV